MNHTLTLLLLGLLVTSSVAMDKWAVLVAGSKGYSNYRHQSDILHAYHVLINGGLDPNKIIVMMEDDIANNSENPYPGQVFNHPDGQDVYAGVKIDYRGSEVTPENFLAVLKGDSAATGGKPVLQSTANDDVFVYFADHGAVGLIAFPTHYLYAKDLNNAITYMHSNGMYKNFLFYLEACESGSMFANYLPKDKNAFALTAANPSQSSWATYCYPHDMVNGKHINSCLGDEFSVNWMEDSDAEMVAQATDTYEVEEQYEKVKSETIESQVMQYGDDRIKVHPIGDFQGNGASAMFSQLFKKNIRPTQAYKGCPRKQHSRVNSRDATLHHYFSKYQDVGSHEHALKLQKELSDRMTIDHIFKQFENKLELPEEENTFMHDEDCLKSAVDHFEQKCGNFTDYSLKYVSKLAKACEQNIPYDFIFHAIQSLNC